MQKLQDKIRSLKQSIKCYGPLFTVDAEEYLELLEFKLEVLEERSGIKNERS